MKGLCKSNCDKCELFKNNKCNGCKSRCNNCWIANYIKIGGKDNYQLLKNELIQEINDLKIEGMSKINELFPIIGQFINLEYVLPNKKKVRFLKDNEVYLANQVESLFNNQDSKKYYGVLGNMNFILVCEYENDGVNPEIIIYKRR